MFPENSAPLELTVVVSSAPLGLAVVVSSSLALENVPRKFRSIGANSSSVVRSIGASRSSSSSGSLRGASDGRRLALVAGPPAPPAATCSYKLPDFSVRYFGANSSIVFLKKLY